MKKTYKKLMALAGAFGLFAFSATAQITGGTVTIDAAVATGGTNYQTFTALATALGTSTLTSPLTVNVVAASGPYVEQVTFTQIAGVSSSNRVTINGNGNTLTFNSTNSAAPHTLLLNGTDYFTVNDLNVVGQGATYALVCVLTGNANYNTFNRCTFTAPTGGTSSIQCPFTINGSPTSATSSGNAGDYNTINTCTLSNGYYGFVSYGLTSAPWTKYNTIVNSRITDFYIYGPYFYYNQNFTMKNCIVDRQTRTTTSTIYALYAAYNNNCMLDGNLIQGFYNGTPNSTSSLYFYMYYQAQPGVGRNVYRNNIITDMKHNGSMYMYQYYGGWDIYNNTFDWDYLAGNHTGFYYNCYAYSNAQYGAINIYNNIITMRKPGTGTRYGVYAGGVTGFTNTDRNNIFLGSGTGNNYIGYYTSNALTQAAWQAQGMDPNGFSVDPQYTSATDLHPTNAAINDMASPMGLIYDQQNAIRNQTTPDIGALEFMSPNCSGTPTNAVVAPNFALCPGEDAAMVIASLTPSLGFSYQWSQSTVSNVGPFTPIAGATAVTYTALGVTANTWYQVVQTCTLPGGGSTSAVGTVNIAGPTASVVPAYEGFEGIGLANRLPNCSWTASGLGAQNKTYPTSASGNRVPRTGTSFATFDNGTTGTSSYYTNPIAMSAGITYSAAVWYATEYFGYNNWSNLQILVGPNQSATNQTVVATVASAISGPYVLLDNTFQVPSSGNYYVCIRATGNSGSAQYLMIDDLSITIPCTPASGNSPTVVAVPSSTQACSGSPIGVTATGADTYQWNFGSTNASDNDTPMSTGIVTYSVIGTNTTTGCQSVAMFTVQVDPSPNVFAVANPPVVCAGSPVIMTAYGANSYAWSNSQVGQVITINPTTSGSYTVIGQAANGCSGTFVQQITVNQLPNVSVSSSNPGEACKSDMLTLTANGGVSYTWYSNTSNVVLQGNPVNTQAASSTIFTVMATGANGCVGKTTLTQNISECTGIEKVGALSGVSVMPNPTTGMVTISFNNNAAKSVSVQDLTGRVIMTANGTDSNINVDLSNLAAGVYYVKLQSEGSVNVVKVVKQ